MLESSSGTSRAATHNREACLRSRGWKSTVASRKDDDGTTSFITIDPGTDGFEFVVGERAGKRILIIRDGQHQYVFTDVA
jgi:hypothetical protein